MDNISEYSVPPKDRYRHRLEKAEPHEIVYLMFSEHLSNATMNRARLMRLFSEVTERMKCLLTSWRACERAFQSWISWSKAGWRQHSHPAVGESLEEYFSSNAAGQEAIAGALGALLRLRGNLDAGVAAAIALPQAAVHMGASIERLVEACAGDQRVPVRYHLAQALGANMERLGRHGEQRRLFTRILKRLLRDRRAEVKAVAASAVFDNARACGRRLETSAVRVARNPADHGMQRQLAWALASNFPALGREARRTLGKLALRSHHWVQRGAVEAIADYFEEVGRPRLRILRELAGQSGASPDLLRSVIGGIEANFDNLQKDYEDVLVKLADSPDRDVVEWVIWVADEKFERIGDHLRERLKAFAKHDDPRIRFWVATTLGNNLEYLRSETKMATYLEVLSALAEDRNPAVARMAASYLEGQ